MSPTQQSPRRLLLVGMSHNPGGTETFMMSAFRALREDFEVWFLQAGAPIAFANEIQQLGGHIAQITPRESNPIRYVTDLRQLFRENDFEVVWLNQSSLSTFAPLVFAGQAGVPIRMLHSHQSRNIGSALTRILHETKKPIAMRLANRRLACADEAARWFFGEREYTFVPNTFPVEQFTFDFAVRNAVRADLDLPAGTVAVSHVANFLPYKNHPFVVEILEELVARGEQVHFLLAGDGAGRADTEALVKEKGLSSSVTFLGVRSDVERILQAADVSILPSLAEGLPYTALEAQAAQLPTLLSTAVGPQTRASELAEYLPIDDGPGIWADRILAAARDSERVRNFNPLAGGAFDIATARASLLEIISSAPE